MDLNILMFALLRILLTASHDKEPGSDIEKEDLNNPNTNLMCDYRSINTETNKKKV